MDAQMNCRISSTASGIPPKPSPVGDQLCGYPMTHLGCARRNTKSIIALNAMLSAALLGRRD